MEKTIAFMGTPQIAADVLQSLIDAGANISLVITQPDRPVGRKKKLTPSPVKELALKYGIPVFQPERIKKDYSVLEQAKPDLVVTCAYGQIVPQAVLDIPTYGCVNLHGSLLPEYRGAAPIQRAIWDGKKESGMSLMQMEKGMDTGGVMDVEKITIDPSDNTTTLFEKMGKAAGRLIVRNLDALLEGEGHFEQQDPEKATYASMISADEEKINFDLDDEQIVNQIRALSLEPGAYGLIGGKKLKILDAEYIPGSTAGKGKLLKEGRKAMSLSLSEGRLLLKRVQLEGKPAMDIAQFVNGAGQHLDGMSFSMN